MKIRSASASWAFFAIASIAWTWYSGKDLNWDFMNYHYYGPYQLLNDRVNQDYFAANVQGYLNPTGFLPLYSLIQSGIPPVAVGVILALLHSANFALLWLIAGTILPAHTKYCDAARFLAVAIAFMAPLQLTTLGGTPLDPMTSTLVLGALYVLLKQDGAINSVGSICVGLLAGVAAGLKLTNLLFLPAFALSLIAATYKVGMRQSAFRFAEYAIAAAVGFLLAHGYWSYELWKEMGNPFFPLFNQIFQSPDFPAQSFQDRRYLDRPWWSFFSLPFDMLSHRSAVYAENVVPDARPLAACLVLAILFLQSIRKDKVTPDPNFIARKRNAAFRIILVFCATFYLVWAATSRIGRYALPLWLLLGPILVASAARVRLRGIGTIVICVTITAQMTFLYTVGNPRWTAAEWGERWIDVDVPAELKETPAAYLTIGALSFSALIPFFNSRSRFTNVVGQYVQPGGDRMTARLRSLLTGALPVKVIFAAKFDDDAELQTPLINDVDAMLSIYGYQLQGGPCRYVQLSINRLLAFNRGDLQRGSIKKFAVCDVAKQTPAKQRLAAGELKKISDVFDLAEKTCPNLFSPRHAQTLPTVRGWMRIYFNSNTQLITDGDSVSLIAPQNMSPVAYGSFKEWQEGRIPSCPSIEPSF